MQNHEFQIVPREDIGLPAQVLSSTGSPRPALSQCNFLTIHYPGVDVLYGDVGDTPAEILGTHSYSVYAKKPWIYNYVIGQDDDPNIYEYAGAFRAAHSAGENSDAIGVQLKNGIREPLTDQQVRKVQWLRGVLQWRKVLKVNHEMRPHRGMPDAGTTCPGELVMARWNELTQTYVPPTWTPAPEPEVPDTHEKFGLHYVQPHDSPWKVAMLHLGSGTRWSEITEANDGDAVMNPGERWKIPGIGGVDTEVLPGEGPWSIIKRAGQTPSQAAVHEFYNWNGGVKRTLKPGDRVFVRYN